MDTENAKEVVKNVYNYLLSFYSPAESSKLSNFRVEEVREKEKNIMLTLSYDIAGDFPFERKREFKDFTVDKNSKKVISMTIRKI